MNANFCFVTLAVQCSKWQHSPWISGANATESNSQQVSSTHATLPVTTQPNETWQASQHIFSCPNLPTSPDVLVWSNMLRNCEFSHSYNAEERTLARQTDLPLLAAPHPQLGSGKDHQSLSLSLAAVKSLDVIHSFRQSYNLAAAYKAGQRGSSRDCLSR